MYRIGREPWKKPGRQCFEEATATCDMTTLTHPYRWETVLTGSLIGAVASYQRRHSPYLTRMEIETNRA